MPANEINDADLVARCRTGERDAFGKLVDRYQGTICALTYSATGDLALSEDLAQDTFVAAWKNLHALRDAGRFRAWLCSIARNKLRDLLQRRKTDLASQAVPVDGAATAELAVTNAVPPEARTIGREEQELLWRTLEQLPENYREPLVLFYRQEKNVREVATTLELSEDAVRQRLTRGRAELKKEIAAFVEESLSRSRPPAAFTAGVVVALTATAPPAAAATVVTAKGATLAKSAGLLGTIGIWIGPLVGFLGGVFGTFCSYKSAKSSRERRFVLKMAAAITLYIVGFLAVLLGSKNWLLAQGKEVFMIGQAALWGSYSIGLVTFILVANRRQRRIQIEDGTYEPHPAVTPLDQPWPRGRVYGALGGSIFGSVAWLVAFALQAGDVLSAVVVTIAAVTLFALSSRPLLRRGQAAARKVFLAVWAGVLVITFPMINLHLFGWIAAVEGTTVEEIAQRVPMWGANLLLGTIGAGVAILFWVSMPAPKKEIGEPGSSTTKKHRH